jgi:hypothetical protein
MFRSNRRSSHILVIIHWQYNNGERERPRGKNTQVRENQNTVFSTHRIIPDLPLAFQGMEIHP